MFTIFYYLQCKCLLSLLFLMLLLTLIIFILNSIFFYWSCGRTLQHGLHVGPAESSPTLSVPKKVWFHKECNICKMCYIVMYGIIMGTTCTTEIWFWGNVSLFRALYIFIWTWIICKCYSRIHKSIYWHYITLQYWLFCAAGPIVIKWSTMAVVRPLVAPDFEKQFYMDRVYVPHALWKE